MRRAPGGTFARVVTALVVGGAVSVSGCGLILGFEDHELFPPDGGADGGGGSGGSGGEEAQGGEGGTSGGGAGGMGGEGGEGGRSSTRVLLIPDAETKSVGMYDPEDGAYLGVDFVPPSAPGGAFELSWPDTAIQGPDGRIYVSDRLAHAIFSFNPDGTFHGVFADASIGVDDPGGMDFLGDEDLFVALSVNEGNPVVARFDLATGERLADFISDDSDPRDLLFRTNGHLLVSNNGLEPNVRQYDTLGDKTDLIDIVGPDQMFELANGNFLVAAVESITEFNLQGQVVRVLAGEIAGGIYVLGNGNWLVTNVVGVQELDPIRKVVVETERAGFGFWKIHPAVVTVSTTPRPTGAGGGGSTR